MAELKYDIKALQRCAMGILDAVDKTCREHGLRYYIFAGTLLGAVRNKKFIPWDDDMDIAMPRPDYNLLLEHCHEWLPSYMEMVHPQTDPAYNQPFAKIQDARTTICERIQLSYVGGAYIDVFPLDGMPKSSLLRRWHFVKYWYWKRLIYLCCRNPYKYGKSLSTYVLLALRKLYPLQKIQRHMQKLQQAYDYDKCSLIVDHDDGLKGVFPKDIFGEPVPIDFEDRTYLSPAQGHAYLEHKYGADYMTPPPEGNRRQHNFDVLELDLPYREWLKRDHEAIPEAHK